MVDSNAECTQLGDPNVPVNANGNAFIPMMVPMECLERISRMDGSANGFAMLNPLAPVCTNPFGPSQMPRSSTHVQDQLRDTELEQMPKPDVFAYGVDSASGTMFAEWHVDARLLQGNSRRIVSPPLEYAFGEHCPVAVFKLMIQPSCARNFAKSKGFGTIHLKCESDLKGAASEVEFVFSVGTDRRGPVMCDFSVHPLGELPKRHDVWKFRSNIDPHSNTVLVRLEIMPSGCCGRNTL
jgi:hypothetical protein